MFYSSPLHTHYGSQSSLIVFWQRIRKSLTVTTALYEAFFAQPNSFLAISSQSPSTAVSSDSLFSKFSRIWILVIKPRIGRNRKHRFQTIPLLLWRCIYLAVAWKGHSFYCWMRVHFRENLFTESLPSNKLLIWLSYFGFQASYHIIVPCCTTLHPRRPYHEVTAVKTSKPTRLLFFPLCGALKSNFYYKCSVYVLL
jgi:hypothetical protein